MNEKQLNAIELTCTLCGRQFIFRRYQQDERIRQNHGYPQYCYSCYRSYQEKKKLERQKIEDEKWAAKKAQETAEFAEKIKHWNVVDYKDIKPKNTLYIIGNGFDLMHNVKSKYRDFSKTIGKNSSLRFALETYLTDDDIWADFESALAHLNISGMADDYIVDMWLDNFNAYDPDSSAADYFLAIETAADPIITIVNELPRRFRSWIETLSIGTDDRPLQYIFSPDGKVLCFNYTEFVENLYGVPSQNVCYIHGCRRKIKGHPKEKLILGHMPGAESDSYDVFWDSVSRKHGNRNNPRRAMVEMAQENVLRLIGEYDEELTKNTKSIIEKHSGFFEGLSDIENVIVIGHSYSEVDWDYFKEVVRHLPNKDTVTWYFGCHSLYDLDSLARLTNDLSIQESQVIVFRTDVISVIPYNEPAVTSQKPVFKRRSISGDRKWEILTWNGFFKIRSVENNTTNYETEFTYYLDKAIFTDDNCFIIVLFRGIEPGVCVFKFEESRWLFAGELEPIPHQCLINNRLRHVFVNGATATFVYNNMVRVYSLENAEFLRKERKKYNPNQKYEGVDVLTRFFKPIPIRRHKRSNEE